MDKDKLKPMLFSVLKDYDGKQFVKDLVSGIIVAIIALPLSIALALASGVGPEQGIYTAIVAGFLISFLGGSKVQIAGPTAAFATIVAGIVAKNGMPGLMTATILAGIILILMGVFRLGTMIKYIPYTITTGFTAGIAVTIVIGQIKDFAGLVYPKGTETIETPDKVKAIINNIGTFNWQAFVVGVVCLLIMIIWPKITAKIPGSLIAVIVAVLMVKFLNMDVKTIGDSFQISGGLPTPVMPDLSFKMIKTVAPDAFTIAILAAIESLLSCVVADGMIGSRHRSNMELVAQGVGNIGSAMFGGIPATGAIARTSANIRNGGKTPVAGIVHALVLLLVLLVLMPYASMIPMPAIAAILFMVAYNMSQWRTFKNLVKTSSKSDIAVLVVTFVLTVVFDLVVAIEVGMVMALVLFMKHMSEESNVKSWIYDIPDRDDDPDALYRREVPKEIRVYEITGPMFFGAADSIAEITIKKFTKCLVLRMRAVPDLDATCTHALEALYDKCQKAGVTMVLSHVNERPMRMLTKAGFVEKIGKENFCEHIDAALARAEEIIKEKATDDGHMGKTED